MYGPTQPDITVDPEIAVLHILDVAARMTIALLMIFHPALDRIGMQRDRGHDLANRIIRDAHRLRRSLADYQLHLDCERELDDAEIPF